MLQKFATLISCLVVLLISNSALAEINLDSALCFDTNFDAGKTFDSVKESASVGIGVISSEALSAGGNYLSEISSQVKKEFKDRCKKNAGKIETKKFFREFNEWCNGVCQQQESQYFSLKSDDEEAVKKSNAGRLHYKNICSASCLHTSEAGKNYAWGLNDGRATCIQRQQRGTFRGGN